MLFNCFFIFDYLVKGAQAAQSIGGAAARHWSSRFIFSTCSSEVVGGSGGLNTLVGNIALESVGFVSQDAGAGFLR
jgi:hypothetical protein